MRADRRRKISCSSRSTSTGQHVRRLGGIPLRFSRAAVTAETDPDARTQRVSQELAYEQNYGRIATSSDAAYDNAFQAKHVGPTDLPHAAPELDSELATVGCR